MSSIPIGLRTITESVVVVNKATLTQLDKAADGQTDGKISEADIKAFEKDNGPDALEKLLDTPTLTTLDKNKIRALRTSSDEPVILGFPQPTKPATQTSTATKPATPTPAESAPQEKDLFHYLLDAIKGE